jgi:hypothetical protein
VEGKKVNGVKKFKTHTKESGENLNGFNYMSYQRVAVAIA